MRIDAIIAKVSHLLPATGYRHAAANRLIDNIEDHGMSKRTVKTRTSSIIKAHFQLQAELSDEQPFITPESDPTTLLDTTNANQDTLDQTLPEATTDETSASGANTGRQEFPRPPPVAAKDKSLAGKAPANGQELPCLPPTATENKTSARTSNQELSRPPIARHKSSALQALRSMEARIPCRSLLAGEVQVNRAWSGTITTGSFSIVLLATTSFGPLLISIPS